jgi:hypothetical protein
MGSFPETGSPRLESMPCYGPHFPFLPGNIRDHGAGAVNLTLFAGRPPYGIAWNVGGVLAMRCFRVPLLPVLLLAAAWSGAQTLKPVATISLPGPPGKLPTVAIAG